jgi:hypothetical protein
MADKLEGDAAESAEVPLRLRWACYLGTWAVAFAVWLLIMFAGPNVRGGEVWLVVVGLSLLWFPTGLVNVLAPAVREGRYSFLLLLPYLFYLIHGVKFLRSRSWARFRVMWLILGVMLALNVGGCYRGFNAAHATIGTSSKEGEPWHE